ncbi:Putative Transcriptional regulator SNIP1 [Penicillium brasilianum]|uniref:Putative Transcriptional regulator SNIP1 n=1 Tax=Penicillium brasilianum TaxID=104259 RepID=A0A0F7TIK4_PENBI|nr:Putative Transcriptional regulator SNIP1 [Penicillium brasilianum]
MAGSQDGDRDRRQRSPSNSSDRTRERRRDTREHCKSSRQRDDDRRSSRRDSPRRRSSRSPSGIESTRRDHEKSRRDRSDHPTDPADDDRRRDRHRSHRHRDDRNRDRDRDHERSSRRHRSPRPRSRSPRRSKSPARALQRRGPLPSQSDAFTGELVQSGDAPPPEKIKPNFNQSGRLAAESNTVQVQGGEGIVLKYHEPPEARKPPAKEAWRFYVFKGEDLLEVVELGERSCWLIGRENRVVDFPLEHPSCSKQHAALQFRYVEKRNEFGDRIGKVKPYLIDLESANGSHVNGEAIPAGRYVEVMDKDVIKFGLSTREYVLMLPN